MSKTVLITGIGGNVGQGIARNIIASKYDLKIVGTNTEAISSGNHLTDAYYVVPYAYEQGYIKSMVSVCKKEHVNLIIPSTDFETFYLAKHRKLLPQVATSSANVNEIFLDKYKTWQMFTKAGIPFAQSCLPKFYDGQFGEVIVKPREGRGSRGIVINPLDPSSFPDTFIVQKYYKGPEITSAFYITKNQTILGPITFKRDLYSGHTSRATVVFDYDSELLSIIKKIIKVLPVRGSCNIQSICTTQNGVVPFEINGRISGTNSIRSHLGFNDVAFTIDEWLYHKKLKKPVIRKGSAVRIFMDIIYPEIELSQIKNRRTKHFIF